jgi:hypothetical protein
LTGLPDGRWSGSGIGCCSTISTRRTSTASSGWLGTCFQARELYDLVNDPHETKNLADRPEYAPQVTDFSARLRAFQARTNAPWIHKWDYE